MGKGPEAEKSPLSLDGTASLSQKEDSLCPYNMPSHSRSPWPLTATLAGKRTHLFHSLQSRGPGCGIRPSAAHPAELQPLQPGSEPAPSLSTMPTPGHGQRESQDTALQESPHPPSQKRASWPSWPRSWSRQWFQSTSRHKPQTEHLLPAHPGPWPSLSICSGSHCHIGQNSAQASPLLPLPRMLPWAGRESPVAKQGLQWLIDSPIPAPTRVLKPHFKQVTALWKCQSHPHARKSPVGSVTHSHHNIICTQTHTHTHTVQINPESSKNTKAMGSVWNDIPSRGRVYFLPALLSTC